MGEADGGGGGEFEEDDDSSSLSPAEKRALDAERRAEWRKARLRSLENVSSLDMILLEMTQKWQCQWQL